MQKVISREIPLKVDFPFVVKLEYSDAELLPVVRALGAGIGVFYVVDPRNKFAINVDTEFQVQDEFVIVKDNESADLSQFEFLGSVESTNHNFYHVFVKKG